MDKQGDDNLRPARRRAAFSICLNMFLALFKGVAGVLSGSSALVGDAIHSATDVVGSAASFLGLWFAGRKHPSFPYGLYKAETVATLITSVAVILAGYEIGRTALMGPERFPQISLALPVAVTSLLITFLFGLYQLRSGRRLHSLALEADARDYLADGMSTAVVVVSLIGGYFGISMDRWAAGAVALFVFWSGGQLLWRALRDLMDEAIDRETEREIIGFVESHPRVQLVERCLSRTAGGRFMVDLDVVVRSHSQEKAHLLSHWIEDEILKRFPLVVMARVKTHSQQQPFFKRLTPVKGPGDDIEPQLAKARYFLIETVERKSRQVKESEYRENPYWREDHKRGYLVGKWLLGLKPEQMILETKKEGTATALLEEAGVEINYVRNHSE